MKELKFRAWSLGNKMKGIEPHYVESFAIVSFTGAPKDIFDGNRSEDGIECIEQYTGLKDKNGKDIYEGDIVRCSDMIRQVYYYEKYASFVFVNNSIDDELNRELFYSANSEYEVIGNIHENPELLEDVK